MKLVLIGGGSKGNYKLDKITEEIIGRRPIETFFLDKKFVDMINKKNPKILYLPTAYEEFDKKLYFAKYQKEMFAGEAGIKEYFEDNFDAKVSTLYLFQENPSDEEIKTKIAEADGIFIGGGTTRAMLRKWQERGVDTLLLEAIAADKPVSGVSAGAICWFDYACTDSTAIENKLQNGTGLEVIKGLGLLKGLAVPHCIEEPLRKPFAKEILQSQYQQTTAICIDDYVAIVVDGDKMGFISDKNGAKATQMRFVNGQIEEAIMDRIE